MSGFIEQDVVNGIEAIFRKFKLGFRIDEDTKVQFGKEAKDLFVEFDTGEKPGSKSFNKLKTKYGNHRRLTMTMNREKNQGGLIQLLEKEISDYNYLLNYRRLQEQFGSW